MVTINGIKAEPTDTYKKEQKEKSASINQILASMQQNYDNLNYGKASIQENEEKPTSSSGLPNILSSFGGDDKGNMLMSLLPMLLKGKGGASSMQDENNLLQGMLKKTSNPMMSKLLEMLPQFKNFTSQKKSHAKKTNVEKNEPKIDSFIKTDEYTVK